MVKLSLAEKRNQFFILLAVFVIALAVLGVVIFRCDNEQFDVSKSNLQLRIEDDMKFEKFSEMALVFVDSVSKQIQKFDPNIQAVFLETDIKKTIGDLNAIYVVNDFDSRYAIYGQGALFFENYFVDRKELKGNISDVERIQRSLDDCLLRRNQLESILQNR